ncbi:MAG: DUF4097 family beta strand repeat protein [Anaerolineae bacterium]|nr:DUF4097 family beta strand repeat protein [Anaerolineae bacterium]
MSKEYTTGEESHVTAKQRGRKGIVFPILLIAIGITALLDNLGVVDVSWQVVVRFWPVLLILGGLDIIFGRHSFLGTVAVGLAALLAIGGLLWVSSSTERLTVIGIEQTAWGQIVTGDIEEPLQDVARLEVDIDLSISELAIGAQSGRQYAVQGDSTTDSALVPSIQYTTQGDTGMLTITQPSGVFEFPWNWSGQNRISVNLPSGVPIDLTVHGDLGGQTLDLSKLDIRSLVINNSGGQVTVILPQNAQMDIVDISADLGAITVSAPNGATINTDSLSIVNESGAVKVDLPSQGSLGDVNITAELGAITITAPEGASLDMRSFNVENGSGAIRVTLPADGSLGDVDVHADLGEIVLNIAGAVGNLHVDSLTVENGSGAVTVNLPNWGEYDATITAELGGITVIVPDDLEARAEITTDLGSKDVTNRRFRKVDDNFWETGGFADATNRAWLDIETDTGGVTIK